MTSYKPGDRVRCIDNSTSYGGFTNGKVYIVKTIIKDNHYISGYSLLIEEDDNGSLINGWCLSYFEPAHIKEFNNKLEDIINE